MNTKLTLTIVENNDGSRTKKIDTRVRSLFCAGAVRTQGGLVLTDVRFEIVGSFRANGTLNLVLSNGAIVDVTSYV